ncbi:MAG: family 10 glycosylhydrolase [Candidatus Sumerlaeia bacterium]|nr:family 10 glycosylhydrolase [Candidatus Sumerlaeia bacterium]
MNRSLPVPWGTLAAACVLLVSPSTTPAEPTAVLMLQDGVPVLRVRELPEARLTQALSAEEAAAIRLGQIVAEQFEPPTATEQRMGLEPLFPEGCAVERVDVDDTHARISLVFTEEFVLEVFDERLCESLNHLSGDWAEMVPGIESLQVVARFPDETEHFPLREFLPPLPPPDNKPEGIRGSTSVDAAVLSGPGQPPAIGQPMPAGALSGATVFVNPGHGWYYSSALGRWATQRGNTNNIIEDLATAESVLQYLIQYLQNAGARVWTCRERDMNPNMVIVDNSDAGFTTTGTWTASTSGGTWKGANFVQRAVSATESGTARWTPNIPADGNYAVYAWYPSSSNRSVDARYTVNHTGGATTWIQNQQRDGNTWRYIGTYHFSAGSNQANGSVVLSDQGTNTSQIVVADSMRFGGGMGDYVDGGSVSGWPRWEESGKYFAGFMGHTYANGTVNAMPRYAAWENESWETNSIYLSWHTNAFNGTARGTETYAYSSGGFGGTFNGVAGGNILRNFVHGEVINDLRLAWDPAWTDRGVSTADFGELNPGNNSEMPAALIEVAFHDQPTDADQIEDPNFRRIVSRAIYQGVVKFYNNWWGYPLALSPEPPTHLRVENDGSGGVTLAWNAPPSNSGNNLLGDPATGYRVYRSTNGRGFDNGTAVSGTSTTIPGLTPGTTHYFRVSATNAGGESFPTETLAVRVRPAGPPPVLIVNGFDRIDRGANIVQDDPYSTANLHRTFLNRMNTYDYSIQHAEAIAAAGIDFDSCANEAIIGGQVNLASYDTVVWILGEESTVDDSFDAAEQAAVTAYLNGGGNLFVSGSEAAWELESQGAGVTFLNSTLHVDYLADDAGGYTASGAAGSIFEGISLTFDNGTSIYDVDFPDRIGGLTGATVCMNYTGAGSGGAAVQYAGGSPERRIVFLGFPFETITSAGVRSQVMAAALDFFGTAADTTPPAAPAGLSATAGDGVVDLDWSDNTEPDLAGYDVYRSTTSGSGHTKINGALVTASSFSDTTVANGTSYFYFVRAVDTSSNESGNSAEVSATPQAPATEIIVDDDQGAPAWTTAGGWTLSGSTGYNGGQYRFATAGAANTSATWTANLGLPGAWEVAVQYRSGSNRTTSTVYSISTASGNQQRTVDQTQNNLTWVVLGTFNMSAGSATVTLDATSSTGGSVVIADAVRFRFTGSAQDPAEMRVAIITVFDDINDTAAIQGWVNAIAGLNCNAIAVHARYRGDATYIPNRVNSDYPNSEPRSGSAGSIDVIQEFTARGHAAGLMVFAYVNCFLVTDGSNGHANPNHIVNTHPEWITYAHNGGNPIVQTITQDSEGRWIDPAIPEARAYVANICGDIISNYDVDGIILDRIRYPQANFSRTTDFGYHPAAIAAFHAQHGGSGVPNPGSADWINFRQDQITAAVGQIYSTITSIDPDRILLAYPLGRFNDAVNFAYQEWPAWMSGNLIDGVLPQIYTSDNGLFSSRCDEHLAAYSGERLMGVTLMAYVAGVDIDGQITITRTKGFDGTSPYRHGSMGALGYFTDLANVYVNPAPWPPMPWKGTNTPPAAPAGLSVTSAANGSVGLDWSDNTEADLAGYNVYRSATSGGPYTKINGSPVGASVYTDTTAVNGQTYHYVVRAVDTGALESGNSAQVSATVADTVAPAAPSGLSVTAAANNAVSLDWADNGESDLAGYNVYRSATSGGPYTKINGSLVGASVYTDTTVINGQTYHYVVRAVDVSTNESGNSGQVSATVVDTIAPAAPSGLAVTAAANNAVSLDWADNGESDLAGYNVYRSATSGGPYTKINGSPVTASSYTDATAQDRQTYHYVVRAVDTSTNESGNSGQVSATVVDTIAPAAPSGLAVTAAANNAASLDWADNGESDLAGYNVYRSGTSGGPYTKINGSPVGASVYTDTTAVNGQTYHYVVRAVDLSSNESGNSGQVSATVVDTIAPAAPAGLAVTSAANGSVGLDWNNNSEGDLAGYNVYRSATSGGPYTKINGSLVTASAYTDNTVANGQTYHYVVRAVDTATNESGNSAQVSATVVDTVAPAPPAGLTRVLGNGRIALDWANSPEGDLAGYNVYRSTASGGPYTKINSAPLTVSAHIDHPVTNGTTYHYVVRAVDTSSNESGNSSQVSGAPSSALPHRIEAEHYDNGGQGVGYSDSDAGNSGGAFRGDNVDIEATSDTGGGYNVGWIATGEWLQWTNVQGAGTSLTLSVRVAALNPGGVFHLEVGGIDVTGRVQVPATGGYQTWTTLNAGTLTLASGANTLRFVADTGGFNVNWLEFGSATHPGGVIDFDSFTLSSYGGQDAQPSSHRLLDGGLILNLYGNTWKRITLNYPVTANTVIEFDYKSDSNEPEVGGIAFDNDDVIASAQSWKVYGTQNDFGSLAFDNYAFSGNGWTHYTIPVGATLPAGTYPYLALFNDMDAGSGSNSYFRDIRVYDTLYLIDNTPGAPTFTTTGTWSTSASGGYNSTSYRWANAGQNHTASWNFNLPIGGNWRVEVIYRAGTNRTTSTRYSIPTAGGTQTVNINQQINNLTWVTLGTWAFNPGTVAVTLQAQPSTGGSVVIADAVRLTYVP